MINKSFSLKTTVFHGSSAPEEGILVGYGAILEAYNLAVSIPDTLSLISSKKRQYKTNGWQVFTSRHLPEDTLYKQLVFALKYEGINLLLLKKLFEEISETEVVRILQEEPLGQYRRKLWFLFEWLLNIKLPIDDLLMGNYVKLVDEKLQFALSGGIKSKRHRIINNLPGNHSFCPLIRKTPKLKQYIAADFAQQKNTYLKNIHKDILQRVSAFLLFKDSNASFSIEGESPKSKRATRWGQMIGQAGTHNLSKVELLRLQQIVIESDRFIEMGFRKKGGFVGAHDRSSGEPIPDHISARWQDIDQLIDGLIETSELLMKSEIDAVIAATVIAYGFVFIHPFQDGNGRIHRYLIHHVLAKKQFSDQGIIFPVSASILDRITDYRKSLEKYSRPLLDFIEWKETIDHNVEVLNETHDYYRYYDLTDQAEFLYECVQDTIKRIIPEELNYLSCFDQFKHYLEEEYDMPDKTVALLVRFLEQNQGKFSKRARNSEFELLTDKEIIEIETQFSTIFNI